MLTFTYNKGQPPPGFEPTTFDFLGNALQIFAKKVAILRNLHQLALNSASLHINSASLRIKSACLRIEAVSLLSIYTKRKTGKHAAWNSKLTYLT